jgi:hypothetical protein
MLFKLRRPRRKYARMVHHLDFALECYLNTNKTEIIYFDRTHAWTFVFSANEGVKTPEPNRLDFIDASFIAKSTKVWDDFKNLGTFSLNFNASKELPGSYVWNAYSSLTELGEGPECFCHSLTCVANACVHGQLGVKATKCSVTVEVLGCANGFCETRLNGLLEQAIAIKG